MTDIKNIAILLIYQDGTYEYEEVKMDMFHMPYFRRLSQKSKKFREVIKGLDLERCSHNEIFLLLAKIGVIEIFNYNLVEIISCPEALKNEFNPYFFISLPKEYASKEQKLSFYDIIRGYDTDLLYFGSSDESGYILEDDVVKEIVLADDLMKFKGGR